MQAARSALLIVWAYVRGLAFVLEQPHSSILFKHPAMNWVAAMAVDKGLIWHLVETYMGHFNSTTLKKTVLASNATWTHSLARDHPGQMPSASKTCTTKTRADGKKTTTGDKTGILKGTQAYTAEFGAAVAEGFVNMTDFFTEGLDHSAGQEELDENVNCDIAWEDSELEACAVALRDQHQLR